MASYVSRDEHQQLSTRVDVLDREVEGEKMVTRHILEQTRRNSDDLAGIKTRLDRIEEKLDGVDLRGLVHKVDSLDRKVDGLIKDLPGIVSDAVREGRRSRTRKR